MKHCFMLLTAIAVFTYSSTAQHISDFDIRHYNTENGLPQNSIKAIASDEYGFIWLASEAGLLRYDGHNFKVYSRKNTGTITSRVIDITKEPGKTDLLVIADFRKMLRIEKGRAWPDHRNFDTVFLKGNQSNDSILNYAFHRYYQLNCTLLFLERELIAQLTLQGNLFWYRREALVSRMQLKPLKDFASVFVLDNALFLSHGNLTADNIQRLEPGSIRQVKIMGDFRKQQQPAGDSKETFFISNHATRAIYLLSGTNLYSINQLPDGNLNSQLLLSGFDLLEHQINSIYYDTARNRLFLGSGTEGLFVLTRKKFFTALYPDKDPFTNVLYSLAPLTDSSLMSGSGLVFYSRKGAKPEQRPLLKIRGNFGYFLLRSSKNEFWFTEGQYAYQLNYNARKVIHKFPMTDSRVMSEAKNGDIWVGTYNSGVFKIDSTGHVSHILSDVGHILCMEWETDTVCWIGTETNLYRFFPWSNKVEVFPAINDKVVRSIHIPRPGEVWICCYEDGLYLWKDSKLTSFANDDYPALRTVHKILEDGKGFFWISTNNGLYQASRADLLLHHRNPAFHPFYFRYSVEEGFLTNEFNGSRQNSGTQLANGFFAFPSMKGVVFFKPENTFPELPDRPIIIDRIEVDNQEIDVLKPSIQLKRGFERITITPATSHMGNDANLKYEFKLNKSPNWHTLTGGSIVFSALSSGENHVIIRKQSGFGKSGYVYCHLTIYVPPAWWQRTWFYIILLVLLGLLFWLAIWFRTRYWRHRSQRFEEGVQNRTLELNDMILEFERSEEKLSEQLHFQRMLNENITHDVNAPLKYLTIYTGEILEHVRNNKLPDIREVEHIHNSTNNIYALVENLTQFLKSKYRQPTLSSINIWQLIQQKLDMFSMGADRKSILLINDTNPNLSINHNETLLGILLHNLIDNALKYTSRGSVVIASYQGESGEISLQIRDTGKGMPEDQVQQCNALFSGVMPGPNVPSGFGFIIVKEIAKLLRVSVHMESVVNKGTTITVAIPEYGPALP
jgi:signal transduction histidine kinase/ligand-binding sensor domain-containing protein